MSEAKNPEIEISQLQRIVSAALTLPSSDNCQPFSFRWQNQTLEIIHKSARAKHELNRKNHASIISLGCALELISIAAESESYNARIELQKNFGSDGEPVWAKVKFVLGGRADSELAGMISRRESDRREFSKGTFADQVFRRIELDAKDFSKVKVHYADNFSEEFKDYYLKCEEYIWDHSRALRDVLRWVRWSSAERDKKQDGVYWKNLGITVFEATLLRILRFIPWMAQLMLPLGARHPIRRISEMQLESSAGLVCFTVVNRDLEALVQVGQLALRAWLRLNASSYGVHPSFVNTISIYDELTGVTPALVKESYRTRFFKAQKVFQKNFKMNENEIPVWAFRVGRSAPIPNAWRTKRRELSQVFEF